MRRRGRKENEREENGERERGILKAEKARVSNDAGQAAAAVAAR